MKAVLRNSEHQLVMASNKASYFGVSDGSNDNSNAAVLECTSPTISKTKHMALPGISGCRDATTPKQHKRSMMPSRSSMSLQKISRIDLDEVSAITDSTERRVHSAPSSSTFVQRMCTEQLLSQMGMDVTDEDYCVEGAFGNRQRRHSYDCKKGRTVDCNYNHPIPDAYEEFGIERKLVRLAAQRVEDNTAKHQKTLVKSSLRNKSIISSDESIKKSLSNKMFVSLQNLGSGILRKRMWSGNKIPNNITPTSSTDETEVPLTPEENYLCFKWQVARSARERFVIDGIPTQPCKKINHDDVLSNNSSSCGDDKTAHMDNRGRSHRRGCSF